MNKFPDTIIKQLTITDKNKYILLLPFRDSFYPLNYYHS